MSAFKLLAATASHRLFRREDWGDWGDWQDWEEDNENCEKAPPGPNGNVPIGACNSYYNYDPQFAPAVAVAVIFGILTAVHLAEGIALKKVSARPALSCACLLQ
jgi:hypothetical protein